MLPNLKKTWEKVEGLAGLEPATRGLGIQIQALILKKINNLTRQKPAN